MSFTQSFFHIVRELTLALGVAILLPLIAYYGTILVHPQPQYTFERSAAYYAEPKSSEDEAVRKAEEERERTALAIYKDALTEFNRIYFFVCLAIAFAALIIGMFLPMVALGSGFILGGFITLITGYISYWGALNTFIKLGSLLAALLCIMVISYRRFATKEE